MNLRASIEMLEDAVARRQYNVVKYLLDSGIEYPLETISELLEDTVVKGYSRLVKLILAYVKANSITIRGKLLHIAARNRDLDTMKILLDSNFDPNSLEWGIRPIHIVATVGFLKGIMCLINHGANIDARDNEGNNALLLANREGRFDAMRLLIDSGSDLRATTLEDNKSLWLRGYREDLKRMKNRWIGKTLSLYNIFVDKNPELNDKLIEKLKTTIDYEEFPVYSLLLRLKIVATITRYELICKSTECLFNLITSSNRTKTSNNEAEFIMPKELIEKIFSHMNTIDLQHIFTTLECLKRQLKLK